MSHCVPTGTSTLRLRRCRSQGTPAALAADQSPSCRTRRSWGAAGARETTPIATMQRVGPRARPLLHRVLQPPSAAATVAAREASEVAELQQSLAAYLRALEGGAAQHALAVARSRLPDAGRGVFLLRGSIPAGAVVTLYPGLMLEPQQFADQAVVTSEEAQAPLPPPFALGNAYLLLLRRQTTTLLVDGRPTGLSAARFAAEAGEAGGPVNAAWLEEEEAGGGEARGGVPQASESSLRA